MNRHAANTGPGRGNRDQEPARPPARKRVVLAGSRTPVTVLRTLVELEEQTSYGEELVRSFVRIQLATALQLAGLTALLLCSWPVVFYLFPELAEITVVGVGLPWLLLGVAPFPMLFGMGYLYNSKADRNERKFVEMVEK